ncbi:L-lactate dehydrogenase [cytochrome] [Bartonella bacilliformis str. Heidi Mejia]|nr:L-lactate dehydrogenase [cytochrome] [Bartonella bacilliformis San Pedro600-02]EYS90993.1 L-lactate dehydrogenase [cytochrome] [Bartonella bacilliformis str. Heidi Mejia]EYS95734.1 L-lactate dehydrogenase [cytochrome] [Bartonella bacilliformis Peru-18]KEG15939.1 L-lactate dehydrogenase [cytochrome] [Bartonella bacilliformis CUSCO5]KEG17893.1 L-lactate dehydrogenase [cytochrome] [Bartonella bacilliformis Hosp800-02]KEG19368.1 L-lactate dehydrogenase [cytochrome] [Bartonella bacilliformis Per
MFWSVFGKLACVHLVFTVDMPVPGARYRYARSGMAGPYARVRRLQAMIHPHWAWNVGIMGRPHDLGNVSTISRGKSN